jgi:hypothetical protein
MTRRNNGDALFDDPSATTNERGGPVYQGVCAQIRRLTAKGKEYEGQEALIDEKLWAGTIAQARSIAASIDRDSGHGGGKQANGVPLAQLHDQLDKLLARLNPEADEQSPFEKLADQWRQEEEENRARRAQASHAEE